MNPVLISALLPLIEGAISAHVADKKTAGQIVRSVHQHIEKDFQSESTQMQMMRADQHMLNKLALQQHSLFMAGWRPLAGWSCALGVFWMFLGAPVCHAVLHLAGLDVVLPLLPQEYLFELLLALLGMAGIRSFDKLKGRAP